MLLHCGWWLELIFCMPCCCCCLCFPACLPACPKHSCDKGSVVCMVHPVRHISLAAIFRACKANKLQWYLKQPADVPLVTCADENVPDLTIKQLKSECDAAGDDDDDTHTHIHIHRVCLMMWLFQRPALWS